MAGSPPRKFLRRLTLLLLLAGVLAGIPASTASATGPCDLSAELAPEIVGGGVDGLVAAPDAERSGAPTNYERYGMAGQFWHTHELGCSDVSAVLGNLWANTIFSWAKAVDRVTITTYQASTTEGPLTSIKDVVDDIVEGLANAIYWPLLRPVIILAAIWLAWYGLIRKRATTTTEGVIWMILAVTVAVWFLSRPADVTGLGKAVTDKTGEVVNAAFAGLPGAQGASCLPAKKSDRPSKRGYAQPGGTPVERNSDALWSTLVCKPWLMGEFGSADPENKYVKEYGAPLLALQAIDRVEAEGNQIQGTSAHQRGYETEVADKLKGTAPYFLFQGKDWTTRLGVAIGALIAALVAGLLIFLVAVSLLVLKIGFLLLLILAPIFLLIGVHPGSGRIVAMRWFEMVIGTLLRQAVLTVVLAVLVYGYALIMSTALPWGLQVMFIALLTVAVFFYRRPFQHLFASMSGASVTSRMLYDAVSAPTLRRTADMLTAKGARDWARGKVEPKAREAAAAGAGAGATGGLAAVATSELGRGRGRDREGDADDVASDEAVQGKGGRRRMADAAADGEAAPVRRRRGHSGSVPRRRGTAPPLNLSSSDGSRSRRRADGDDRGGGSWFGGGSRTADGDGDGGGWFSGSGRDRREDRPVPAPRSSAPRPAAPSAPPRRSRGGTSGRKPPPLWMRPTKEQNRADDYPFWLRPPDGG